MTERAGGEVGAERPKATLVGRATGAALLAALFAVGLAVAWFGGDLVQPAVDRARAAETWARANGPLAAGFYFLIVSAVMLVAIPLGNVLLLIASYLIGTPLALAAHVIAVLLVAPIHYGVAALGLGGPVRRWAEDIVASRRSKIGSAVFTAARADGIATAVALRLGLAAPNAVTNVAAALLGVPLAAYLIGSALVVWMRPAIIAWLGGSLSSLQTAGDVTGAVAQAAALALPLAIIPLAVLAWLAKRHMPRD